MNKRRWYIFGDPAVREKVNEKAVTVKQYIVCGLIAAAAMGSSFVVGYLYGLTCFYWG